MNINSIFPTRFVKADDLGDKLVTVTIKSATMEDLGQGTEKETKLVIWFERATKGLVLNKTNAFIIAHLYGPETDSWLGQQVILYAARVKAFGSWHNAVRVREQIPARNVGAAKMPDAMLEEPPLDDEDDLLDVDEGQDSDAHNAPRTPQTPTTPSGGTSAQNGTPRSVDAETGGVLFGVDDPTAKHESPPHQRLFGQLASGFGPDADAARPWLILKWTKKVSPGLERSSAADLSNDEKDILADYIRDNLAAVQRAWKSHKAAQVQATGEPVPA